MEEKEKPKPQDDKRFFKQGNEQEDKKEEKMKIPFEFPDIKTPGKIEPALPKDIPNEKMETKIQKEEKEDKVKTPLESQKEPQETILKPQKQKDTLSIERMKKLSLLRPALPIIYILSLVSCLLLIILVLNLSYISTLKKRLDSNAEVIKDVLSKKEETLSENKSLQDEVDRLRAELISTSALSEGQKRQIEGLKSELDRNKEKYAELQETIKKYSKEIRNLATRRIEYYDAYKNEEEKSKRLAMTIEQMKKQIDALKVKMDSIDEEYKEKEAVYIYDKAFLSVEGGLYDEAIKNFEQFIKLMGEDADTYYNIAYIYEHGKKDRKMALKNYKKYVELNPDAEDIYEVKMKIASLERSGTTKKVGTKTFKIKLGNLKY